jgi:hypothetical protein
MTKMAAVLVVPLHVRMACCDVTPLIVFEVVCLSTASIPVQQHLREPCALQVLSAVSQ